MTPSTPAAIPPPLPPLRRWEVHIHEPYPYGLHTIRSFRRYWHAALWAVFQIGDLRLVRILDHMQPTVPAWARVGRRLSEFHDDIYAVKMRYPASYPHPLQRGKGYPGIP